jgi:hypothetical protein
MNCSRCRYKLGPHAMTRCPECGASHDPDQLPPFFPLERRHFRFLLAIPLIPLALFVAFWINELAGPSRARFSLSSHASIGVFAGVVGVSTFWQKGARAKAVTVASSLLLFLLWPALAMAYFASNRDEATFASLIVYPVIATVAVLWNLAPYMFGRVCSLMALSLLCLLFVPYQTSLALQSRSLHAESMNIIKHADDVRARTGTFPSRLVGYEWMDPRHRARIRWRIVSSRPGRPETFEAQYTLWNNKVIRIESADGP